jgi:hypothetical protein
MAGGNYFISLRQIIESEKRIKVVSLLKHSSLELERILPLSSGELLSTQYALEDYQVPEMVLDDIHFCDNLL